MKGSIPAPYSLKKRVESSFCRDIITVGMGSLLIALSARVCIPLPFSLMPFTLQSLAVLFLGASLGSKKGALCVLAYLAEALMGLPVLAGGLSDPLFLVGPRAGYLIGFLFQASLIGWFTENQKTLGLFALLSAGALTCVIQLALGAAWLSLFIGWNAGLLTGFYAFIPIEIAKVLAITAYFKKT